MNNLSFIYRTIYKTAFCCSESPSGLGSYYECLLVVEIPRRHLEVSAEQHRHLGQRQRPMNRDVRSVVLHRPARIGGSEFTLNVQLLEKCLIAHLLQQTHAAEAGHVYGSRRTFNFFRWDWILRCGCRTPFEIEANTMIFHYIDEVLTITQDPQDFRSSREQRVTIRSESKERVTFFSFLVHQVSCIARVRRHAPPPLSTHTTLT